MKELFSAFGSEVFRPMMTIFAPGALAISSWFVGFLQTYQSVKSLAYANHTETAFLLVLTSFIIGLLIENVGSTIESQIFDRWRESREGWENHELEWYSYLRRAYRVEPVGHRYMRTLVLHLKFELAIGVSLLLFASGLFITNLSRSECWWTMTGCGLAAVYLIWFEALRSHFALSRLRQELLRTIDIVG